jgi:hypothetical protein
MDDFRKKLKPVRKYAFYMFPMNQFRPILHSIVKVGKPAGPLTFASLGIVRAEF